MGQGHKIEPEFLEVLACPACRSGLRQEEDRLVCTSDACGLAYPIEDGIPVLLVEEAVGPDGESPPADEN